MKGIVLVPLAAICILNFLLSENWSTPWLHQQLSWGPLSGVDFRLNVVVELSFGLAF